MRLGFIQKAGGFFRFLFGFRYIWHRRIQIRFDMKNPLFVLLASALFCSSCGGGSAPDAELAFKQEEQREALNAKFPIRENLGPVETRVFEGVIPCADCPGIKYVLALTSQKHSGDGVYSQSMIYLQADRGKDAQFKSSGTWTTQRGDADDKDATVYELSEEATGYKTYFLYQRDSLTMLSPDLKKAESELNYTIRLVK